MGGSRRASFIAGGLALLGGACGGVPAREHQRLVAEAERRSEQTLERMQPEHAALEAERAQLQGALARCEASSRAQLERLAPSSEGAGRRVAALPLAEAFAGARLAPRLLDALAAAEASLSPGHRLWLQVPPSVLGESARWGALGGLLKAGRVAWIGTLPAGAEAEVVLGTGPRQSGP